MAVSRLTVEQKDGIKLRLFNAVDPATLALLGQLNKARAKIDAGSLAAMRYSILLLASTDRFDKRVKQAEEIAAKARNIGFAA